MPRKLDLIGKTFGYLTVLREEPHKNGRCCWSCRCTCGKISNVVGDRLISGNTKSCGCLKSEVLHKRSFKHGEAKRGKISSEYRIWSNILQRCKNPDNPRYSDYGGRGIKVCDRWMKFENFLSDVGRRPTSYSLDRKDNDLGYSPENCGWVGIGTQNRNKRNSTKSINFDLHIKNRHLLSANLHSILYRNYKSSKLESYLGCTIGHLKYHLESQFKEGMSWANYGRNGWVIDHIIPIYKTDLAIEENIYKSYHYTNLRPLWDYENAKRQRI